MSIFDRLRRIPQDAVPDQLPTHYQWRDLVAPICDAAGSSRQLNQFKDEPHVRTLEVIMPEGLFGTGSIYVGSDWMRKPLGQLLLQDRASLPQNSAAALAVDMYDIPRLERTQADRATRVAIGVASVLRHKHSDGTKHSEIRPTTQLVFGCEEFEGFSLARQQAAVQLARGVAAGAAGVLQTRWKTRSGFGDNF